MKTSTVSSITANPQPSLALAGLISYINDKGDLDKIPFGDKDRAANCLHTLCQGDKVCITIHASYKLVGKLCMLLCSRVITTYYRCLF